MAMAICAIVIAVLGIASSSLAPTARRGPLTPLVAVHAAMSVAWLALFVRHWRRGGKIDLHRCLGTVTMRLAPVMITLG
jgi:hypothetical protein